MKNLDELLERWAVHAPGMWRNVNGPAGWWAVSNEDDSIVAYFFYEADAYRFRLAEINRELNG